jgi:hypothetical protein
MTLRDILVRAGDATFAQFDILRERYLSLFTHSSDSGYTSPGSGAYTRRGKKKLFTQLVELCVSTLCHAKVARLLSVLHWKTE